MRKLCNFRLETTLIKELDELPGTRTEKVVSALQLYLQNNGNVTIADLHDLQDDDLYSQIYGNIFCSEIQPLKTELQVKDDMISILKTDRQFLQNQNNALMLVKMPLLARIKLKLLQ